MRRIFTEDFFIKNAGFIKFSMPMKFQSPREKIKRIHNAPTYHKSVEMCFLARLLWSEYLLGFWASKKVSA
jgi:hypothetical protein